MLEDLGNLGDFIGGIAVVATLIYLALQIRQNTAALRMASRQDVVEGMRRHLEFRYKVAPGTGYIEGLRRWPDLPAEEGEKVSAVLADHALFIQSAFAAHDSGALDDETWGAYLEHFAATIQTPGGREWWERVARPIYVSNMVAAVDARVAQGDIVDLLALELPAELT